MILYDKPGFIEVVHRAAGGYILFDWTSFMVTLEEIQELHRKALEGLHQHRCPYYVAETSKVRNVLRQEVIEWWQGWVPKLVTGGLRAIVTVVPASAIASLSTRSWQAEINNGIVLKNVRSLAEAESSIQVLRAGNATAS